MKRLFVAVAALVLAWLIAPAAVPIYDGLQNPDEPYRYVQPPAGAKPTKPPTTAQTTLKVTSTGLSSTGYSNSAEIAPQVVFYIPAGSLRAPAGATSITVTETPVAPSPPLPTDGTIVGNVYHVAATTSAGPPTLIGHGINQTPTLDMRAPSARQPGPVFEHRSGSGWVRSTTLRIGQDVYQTSAATFGDWALVQLTHPPGTKSSGGGVNVGLLAGGIAVLVLAGAIIAIRLSRGRRAA